jgi:hypothetical protein
VTSTPDFFFGYTDTVVGGNLWGQLILMAVFSISYMSLSSYPSERAFAASSFITLVSCVLMIGLVPVPIVGSFELAVTASATLLALVINGRGGPSV